MKHTIWPNIWIRIKRKSIYHETILSPYNDCEWRNKLPHESPPSARSFAEHQADILAQPGIAIDPAETNTLQQCEIQDTPAGGVLVKDLDQVQTTLWKGAKYETGIGMKFLSHTSDVALHVE